MLRSLEFYSIQLMEMTKQEVHIVLFNYATAPIRATLQTISKVLNNVCLFTTWFNIVHVHPIINDQQILIGCMKLDVVYVTSNK